MMVLCRGGGGAPCSAAVAAVARARAASAVMPTVRMVTLEAKAKRSLQATTHQRPARRYVHGFPSLALNRRASWCCARRRRCACCGTRSGQGPAQRPHPAGGVRPAARQAGLSAAVETGRTTGHLAGAGVSRLEATTRRETKRWTIAPKIMPMTTDRPVASTGASTFAMTELNVHDDARARGPHGEGHAHAASRPEAIATTTTAATEGSWKPAADLNEAGGPWGPGTRP